MGNKSYQLTSAGRSANHGQIGRHWLAGNSYFPCGRIFVFCFSEPLGINIEVLNSLLLWKELFIQIYFDGLWSVCLSVCPVPKKIHFKGDKKIFSHAALLGEAKPNYVKTFRAKKSFSNKQ